jgi:hypothetical protein
MQPALSRAILNQAMAIRGICLIKNEADFIERSLRHNARFFDQIYVFDNASTDDSWPIVQRLAEQLPDTIIPYASEDRDFRDGLRALPFERYRHEAQPGDWWCRLDADEVYIDDPRTFLANVPYRHHVVWTILVEYHLTELDLPGGCGYPPDLMHPFADLPRHYLANAAEPRFFRHRSGLEWQQTHAWPRHVGLVHPTRIRARHYQWRSPKQVQLRLETRREASLRGYRTFGHSLEKTWQEKVRRPSELHLDRGNGEIEIDFASLPRYLEAPWHRLLKGCMHGVGIWP